MPLRTVDPVYIEGTSFLGPDRGGDKPYRLLAEVMRTRDEVALGTYVMRGKENLVAIRAYQGGLVLHTLYFADEVRDFREIETGKGTIRREEMQLALRLIETLRRPAFDPEDFEDTYRARVEAAARAKARGKAVRRRAARGAGGQGGGPDGGPPAEPEAQADQTGSREARAPPRRTETGGASG